MFCYIFCRTNLMKLNEIKKFIINRTIKRIIICKDSILMLIL